MLTEILDVVAGSSQIGYLRASRVAYASVNAAHVVGISFARRCNRQLRPENRGLVDGGSLAGMVGDMRAGCRFRAGARADLRHDAVFRRGGAYIAYPAFQLKTLILAAGLVNVFAFRPP
ncbi:hypothetical protein [Sinorhizobium meliloti]|uniref:hypothetical protein n=1 Tax=Rhizobium meliloti TaxID=382 RepID=UPI001F1ACF52|nr:hypothetical protein [Sinorhizobium meliloti]